MVWLFVKETERNTIAYIVDIMGLAIGLFCGFTAHEQLQEKQSLWRGPHLIGAVLFVVLVLSPLGLYLMVKYPAWSHFFWLPEREYSQRLAGWCVILAPVFAILGFIASVKLCQKQKTIWALSLSLLILLLLVIGLIKAPDLSQDDSGVVGLVLSMAIPLIFIGWLLLIIMYQMEARRLKQAKKDRPKKSDQDHKTTRPDPQS
jgi:hypothetical protein